MKPQSSSFDRGSGPQRVGDTAWASHTFNGEEITVEADPAVDLSGGRLKGIYICRARALTASYVRRGTESENDIVLVSAATGERAIAKIIHAIDSKIMIRREAPTLPPLLR